MDNTDNNQGDVYKATDDSRLSFGAALKNARLAKGMSVEDIMEYSRISKFMVQQIEAENLSKLPEPVFLKGFLKTYAQAVGLDPADVIERYNRALNREPSPVETARETAHIRRVSYRTVKQPRERKKGGAMKGFMVLFVAAVVGAGVFIYRDYKNKTVDVPVEPVKETQTLGGAEATSVPKPAVPPTAENPAASKPKEAKPIENPHLEVVCVKATAVKVSVDGGAPDVYTMKPMEHIEITAKNMFNILIEDKCGVNLLLNSNPVTLPGKCGQTVNIQLP